MKITRGTTPTVRLTVTDFELYKTDEIHLYFSQGGKLRLKKVTPEVTVEGNTLITELTQEETYKLKKTKKLKYSLGLKGLTERFYHQEKFMPRSMILTMMTR